MSLILLIMIDFCIFIEWFVIYLFLNFMYELFGGIKDGKYDNWFYVRVVKLCISK